MSEPIAYFTAPPREANGAGVVVLMDGSGVSQHVLRTCERLAEDGYVAVAPDLYRRYVSSKTEAEPRPANMAGAWTRSLYDTTDRTLEDVAAAVDVVRSFGVERVGMLGYCFGGSFTYAAVTCPDIDLHAGVAFYGASIAKNLDVFGPPLCPQLLIFGGRDEYIPASDIEAVRRRYPDDVVVYAESEHQFMRNDHPGFDQDAANDAWGRASSFLARHLLR